MAWNRENPKPPSAAAARNAPKPRRSLTDAERCLWIALRKHLPDDHGTHFRKQVAIGPYVVDFVCLGRRLIVEVDGDIHIAEDQRARDFERDVYLRSEGFRVLRVTNQDVMLGLTGVLRKVSVELDRATPTPNPSPQGGGEWLARGGLL